MYSLSVFAKMKGMEFHYVVSNLSSNLSANPIGNFKFALENGMKIYVDKDRWARARALAYELAGLKESEICGGETVNLTDNRSESCSNLKNMSGSNLNKFDEQVELDSANYSKNISHKNSNLKKSAKPPSSNLPVAQDCFIGDSLFINEGVWQPQAEEGFISQARQIERWADAEGKVVDIFLPSGTGTSAAFLAKHVKFDVFTCPCVGDADYLKSEIEALTPNSKVRILPPPKKYHFGDLKPELYQIWREVCEQTGIEFKL